MVLLGQEDSNSSDISSSITMKFLPPWFILSLKSGVQNWKSAGISREDLSRAQLSPQLSSKEFLQIQSLLGIGKGGQVALYMWSICVNCALCHCL